MFSHRACFLRHRVTYSVYNGVNKLSCGSGACPPPAKLPEMSCRVLLLFLCSKTIHRCVNGGISAGLLRLGMKNRRGVSGCLAWVVWVPLVLAAVTRRCYRCKMHTNGHSPPASTPSVSVRWAALAAVHHWSAIHAFT